MESLLEVPFNAFLKHSVFQQKKTSINPPLGDTKVSLMDTNLNFTNRNLNYMDMSQSYHDFITLLIKYNNFDLFNRLNQADEAVNATRVESTEITSQGASRAPPRCTNCGTLGHKRARCPNRVNT